MVSMSMSMLLRDAVSHPALVAIAPGCDCYQPIQGIRSFVGDGSVSFLSLVVLSIK
jgi:hypothetical protein